MGDPVNKQYRVHIGLPSNSPLAIGMTTEVNIVVREESEALLIPESALDHGHVWRAVRRAVSVGAYGDRVVEIREGLEDTDEILLDPPSGLEEGARVRPLDAPPLEASR